MFKRSDWENLTPEQQQYLLHVRPPGDTITMVIRNIIEDNNITNAAIIFDDTFGKESFTLCDETM